ncbi:hypothetical protein RRG08_001220 [Elysia crispata]|uniref:Uncharacterized protein n=1 Tax=Elysia crispata TaxID=231223 RepID=A0AAE1EBJ8_9GAST|nr:hypothetical protein RRG08_001220 [Elysia crispata]
MNIENVQYIERFDLHGEFGDTFGESRYLQETRHIDISESVEPVTKPAKSRDKRPELLPTGFISFSFSDIFPTSSLSFSDIFPTSSLSFSDIFPTSSLSFLPSSSPSPY